MGKDLYRKNRRMKKKCSHLVERLQEKLIICKDYPDMKEKLESRLHDIKSVWTRSHIKTKNENHNFNMFDMSPMIRMLISNNIKEKAGASNVRNMAAFEIRYMK